MTDSTPRAIVLAALAELNFDGDHADETRLYDLAGFDSRDFVETIREVEARAGIEITDDQADDIQTVGDLIRVVEKACG